MLADLAGYPEAMNRDQSEPPSDAVHLVAESKSGLPWWQRLWYWLNQQVH